MLVAMAAGRRTQLPALLLALALAGAACGGRPEPEPAPGTGPAGEDEPLRVLAFTRTLGFRHASIPVAVQALRRVGPEHRFVLDHTEDAGRFRAEQLRRYQVVLFLNTSGDVLEEAGRAALRAFVEGGGGWVGVHAAADSEQGWPWYETLLGTRFDRHPAIQRATVRVVDRAHPSTAGLPAAWVRSDEWYDFRSSPAGRVHVLAVLDEATYRGGRMGADHPIAWCHRPGRGRAFYTAGGHTGESWAEPLFLAHVAGGLRWAAGAAAADC
jgi:type 1 glutamine amidotransferase